MSDRKDLRRGRLAMAAILGGAVLVRVGVMATGLERLDDPDQYLVLARSMAEGRGFAIGGRATAYRPPLYPMILAPMVGMLGHRALPWGVGALHLMMGVGAVWLADRAARGWGVSGGRRLAVAAVVAFDPVLVVQSRSVMTETPAALLVAATLAAITLRGARGAILGGVGFGLGSLCRPSLLPAAVLAAVAALVVGPGGWRGRVARSGLLMVATAATLGPWAWRNARVLGEPVWTTTHGGYTMALANNPAYYADVLDGPPGAVWSGPRQAAWFAGVGRSTAGMTEPESDRALRSETLAIVRDRPGDFARASIARLGRFWGLSPSPRVYPRWLRWASAAWTVPLWVALVAGLVNRAARGWPGVVASAFPVALTAVHLVYWTDLRMRAPIVPAIALIAACAGMKTPGPVRNLDGSGTGPEGGGSGGVDG